MPTFGTIPHPSGIMKYEGGNPFPSPSGIETSVVEVGWNKLQSQADRTDARCDVYPKRSDHTDKMIPCVFAQRQSAVTITRDDGVTHRLAPVGDEPGNFRDQTK